MNDDLITNGDVAHVRADGVDDAARIRADDVELGRLIPSRLALGDVDRDPPSGPHVVEVDPCGHRGDQDVVRREQGDVDHLIPDRLARITEPVRSNEHRVHARRDLAEQRELTDVVYVLHHATEPFARSQPPAKMPNPSDGQRTRQRMTTWRRR